MTWKTVAICEQHWQEEEPGREPFRMRLDTHETEHCYRCGCFLNQNVIYVRRDVTNREEQT